MSLPDKFHISWRNYASRVKDVSGDWVDVTLASTVAAESAYPLTNMQNQVANEPTVIDMTGETTVTITDTGSPDVNKYANCFRLHNHNLPKGTTIRLRLYPDINQGGAVVYDSGEVDVGNVVPWGSFMAGLDPIEGTYEEEGQLKVGKSLFFDTVQYKSFQLDITNTAGFTDDEIAIDKLWIGAAYAPVYGPVMGWEMILLDDSEHQRKPGGGMETVQFTPRRSLRVQFEAEPTTERNTMRHLLDRAKKSGDLLITTDPNDAHGYRYETTSIYRRTSRNAFTNAFYNGHNFGLAVEEN